jgi:hypothetical protein
MTVDNIKAIARELDRLHCELLERSDEDEANKIGQAASIVWDHILDIAKD